MVEDAKLRRGHIRVLHEFLGKNFAAFQLRCLFRGSEDPQSFLLKGIDDAQTKRIFRPDYRETDILFLGKPDECIKIRSSDGYVDGIHTYAGVSRSAKNLL